MNACINCTHIQEHHDKSQRDHNSHSSKCAASAKSCVSARQDETLCGGKAKYYQENQKVAG